MNARKQLASAREAQRRADQTLSNEEAYNLYRTALTLTRSTWYVWDALSNLADTGDTGFDANTILEIKRTLTKLEEESKEMEERKNSLEGLVAHLCRGVHERGKNALTITTRPVDPPPRRFEP